MITVERKGSFDDKRVCEVLNGFEWSILSVKVQRGYSGDNDSQERTCLSIDTELNEWLVLKQRKIMLEAGIQGC